uniref:Uncharacterized protein n=1 Tax=Chlamydomonas leiostraca TaxID=1034604 RepID=A0A7S0X110_9CHLO|mmetsp:Transcript_4627/g.11426  ORF Transcript_4627/g.11426 Transcript_4627/m.11426 type:complete len:203 (+) Transcript_4627:78-686(+)|eukprot:CAMPEP_0202886642 /NCGR_PEP_ID=MMETSP1391-20130828/42279_1 /ASSEMBLY_ACC=CAM_ASM_000867 /TAXON_ID=1034604 /ORGANISM="Chlamydomonas leiostraca, Strain SAG 11-49" /LENGTH=202 /DNA_ID=CAMNT_0049569917 /DNA_START=37 /DNA_END=645 /DNA_ORIENTATION=-
MQVSPQQPDQQGPTQNDIERERLKVQQMQLELQQQQVALQQQQMAMAQQQAARAAAPPQVYMQAPPQQYTVATTYEDERYCGPITWLIGCFVFPCICFCPVDTRPRRITQQTLPVAGAQPLVVMQPAPVAVPVYAGSAPPATGVPAQPYPPPGYPQQQQQQQQPYPPQPQPYPAPATTTAPAYPPPYSGGGSAPAYPPMKGQ